MQNAFVKKRIGAVIGTLTFLVLIALFVCLPNTSYGATVGSEKPNIYCTYTDSDGKQYDGDKLPAGTYNVNFYLEGVSELSVVQVTAKYSADATVDTAAKSLLSANIAGISSMGTITQNSNLVFGFVSDSDSCSAINSDGTLLATFSVAFANKCDASNVISVSTSPNETFVLTDYNDGLKDEYALVNQADDYDGSLYLMACDVSPSQGHSVTGSLVIMTDGNGNTQNKPVCGEYTVNVYSDSARTELVGTTTSSLKDGVNSFPINSLNDGTYYLSISSKYAITREDIKLIVNGLDISDAVIPMVACNLNGDDSITMADTGAIYKAIANGYDSACDFNADGSVTMADTGIIYSLIASDGYYNGLEIK